MLRKENGITLVALVITIIVLLILAGVTLMLTLGENGLFSRARSTRPAMEAASAKEKVSMAVLDVQAGLSSANDTTATLDGAGNTTNVLEKINDSLNDEYNIATTGSSPFQIYKGSAQDTTVVNENNKLVKAGISVTNGVITLSFDETTAAPAQ